MQMEQKFRENRVCPCVDVQTLDMYVRLLCAFELPFVAKAIKGRIRREGLQLKLSQFFLF